MNRQVDGLSPKVGIAENIRIAAALLQQEQKFLEPAYVARLKLQQTFIINEAKMQIATIENRQKAAPLKVARLQIQIQKQQGLLANITNANKIAQVQRMQQRIAEAQQNVDSAEVVDNIDLIG